MAPQSRDIRRRSSVNCDLSADMARATLMQIFTEADENRSGCVSRKELVKLVKDMGVGLIDHKEDTEAIFATLDINGDGQIDASEFCAMFEPSIVKHGTTSLSTMDCDTIMKETFDCMLARVRKERNAVNRSFMQAREGAGADYVKDFLGSKWRMEMFEAFYHAPGDLESGHPVPFASRLSFLRAALADAAAGRSAWVDKQLKGNPVFSRVGVPPPPPSSRTDWTRLVPPPVLTGHVSSLLPY